MGVLDRKKQENLDLKINTLINTATCLYGDHKHVAVFKFDDEI